MHVDLKDDLRQAIVVAKNEIKKFMAGKKIILFAILVLGLEILNLVVPMVWGGGFDVIVLGDGFGRSSYVADALLGNIALFIIIAAVLFTATSIVSEFEERTALVLFTKPIRKWSIYFGKLLASLVIMIGFILLIYLYAAVVCLAICGNLPYGFLTSLGLAICAAFGSSGLAILLSSVFKKGSTASIMTLVVYLLVFLIIGGLITTYAHVETWWMLDSAMGTISTALGNVAVVDYDPLTIFYSAVPGSELARAAGAMAAWGVATSVIGFLFFQKRDF